MNVGKDWARCERPGEQGMSVAYAVDARTCGCLSRNTVITASTAAAGSDYRNRSPGLNVVDWVAFVLLIVGGLNWGLVGVANFDLVAALFGPGSTLSRIVYGLVGLSALWAIGMGIRWASNRGA